jgi:hypothetical protein
MGRIAAKPRELQAESPYLKDAFGIRNLQPELEIVPVGLGCRRVAPHTESRPPVARHDA